MNCIFDQTLLDILYYENLSKFYSLKGSYVVKVVQKHSNRENGPYRDNLENSLYKGNRDRRLP